MNRRVLTIGSGLFVIVAALGFLIWSYVSTRNYVAATAEVTSVEYDPNVAQDDEGPADDYLVKFQYTVNEKTYNSSIHAGKKDYAVGDTIKIKYDPQKPGNTEVGSMSLPMVIGIGVVIVASGVLIMLRGLRS